MILCKFTEIVAKYRNLFVITLDIGITPKSKNEDPSEIKITTGQMLKKQ